MHKLYFYFFKYLSNVKPRFVRNFKFFFNICYKPLNNYQYYINNTQKYIEAKNKNIILCIITACRQLENECENLEESKKL